VRQYIYSLNWGAAGSEAPSRTLDAADGCPHLARLIGNPRVIIAAQQCREASHDRRPMPRIERAGDRYRDVGETVFAPFRACRRITSAQDYTAGRAKGDWWRLRPPYLAGSGPVWDSKSLITCSRRRPSVRMMSR